MTKNVFVELGCEKVDGVCCPFTVAVIVVSAAHASLSAGGTGVGANV